MVHRYSFTTSRFTDLYHQLHSFSDEAWSAVAADDAVVAGAHAAAVDPAGMPDSLPATGSVKITEWIPSSAVANDESVTVLLRDTLDLSGHRLDYRTLPSAAPFAPAGTELAAPDLTGPLSEGPPVDTVIFEPAFRNLTGFTVVDPPETASITIPVR